MFIWNRKSRNEVIGMLTEAMQDFDQVESCTRCLPYKPPYPFIYRSQHLCTQRPNAAPGMNHYSLLLKLALVSFLTKTWLSG